MDSDQCIKASRIRIRYYLYGPDPYINMQTKVRKTLISIVVWLLSTALKTDVMYFQKEIGKKSLSANDEKSRIWIVP